MTEKLCECGCGKPTTIARQSHTKLGWTKGEGIRFILGHSGRAMAGPRWEDEPWEKTEGGWETPCWRWTGPLSDMGYGLVPFCKGKSRYAHQAAYTSKHGEIPAGLEIDHLCRNHWCVNPDHLEAVTHAENMRRGANAKLTHEQVAEIRECYTGAYGEQVRLARHYGVSTWTIYAVLTNRVWK